MPMSGRCSNRNLARSSAGRVPGCAVFSASSSRRLHVNRPHIRNAGDRRFGLTRSVEQLPIDISGRLTRFDPELLSQSATQLVIDAQRLCAVPLRGE